MLTDKTMHRSRLRCIGLLLGLLAAIAPWPVHAGHDQDEEDLTYFLPMAPERAKQLLDAGEKIFFFDLREPEEFKRGRLPGAASLPLKELPSQMAKVPRAGRVVLYCTCGPGNIEEGHSYQLLRDQGYRNVSVLVGGISEWQKRGYPVETEPRS
jgi:rhodanese-related sulfurtransferase